MTLKATVVHLRVPGEPDKKGAASAQLLDVFVNRDRSGMKHRLRGSLSNYVQSFAVPVGQRTGDGEALTSRMRTPLVFLHVLLLLVFFSPARSRRYCGLQAFA